MRKLMFMLAAVAAAGIVQAASINWSMGMNNGVDASGNVIEAADTGTAIVLAYIGTTGNTSYATAIAVSIGTWDIGVELGEKYAGVSGKLTDSSYTGDGKLAVGNVYAIMFQDKDGTLYQLKNSSGALITDTLTVDASFDTRWSKSLEVQSDFMATSASYASVPEPTSGLLMLMGLAGLALRRRRA